MPIRPENKALYPPNWKEIRAAILDRAGHKCEWCGAPNHAYGVRLPDGTFDETAGRSIHGDIMEYNDDGLKVIRIVLTIAHIHDPDPANCDASNLAALCQRCHNKHDAPMRAQNRRLRAQRERAEAGESRLL